MTGNMHKYVIFTLLFIVSLQAVSVYQKLYSNKQLFILYTYYH